MYIIIVYDVSVKRVNKVKSYLRQHLNWVQNSVFEGELTEGQFEALYIELKKIINKEQDSVIVYKLGSLKYTSREIIGEEKNPTENLL